MDDMTEPIRLTFLARLEGRTKTLYEFKHEGSLVQHSQVEIEGRLSRMVTRAIKEIHDSGFTNIELARIRDQRDAALEYLKKKEGYTDGK